MEFKKSRLEIDSNSSIPGTSSSSLSPGGLNTSTGGPYRGRYTRSSLGVTGSSTGSRFSPYSLGRDRTTTQRRSIPVIRATREDDSKSGYSLGFGGTSSTAQKIMNTLASMSTPVMNAGRVRIDSIKSVRPVQMTSPLSTFGGSVLSASSKFCGPPKTSSPLLLPKSPSGIRLDADKSSWSLKCLSIPPKMVDCGTNTDELPFIAEDNKNNVTMTSPKPARKVSVTVKEEGGGRLADLIGKFKCTNGDFKFDSPWALKEVDKYLGSNQHKKDLEKDTSTSQSSSSLESSESDAESERNIISKNKMPNGKHELDSSSKIKQEQTSYSKPFSSTSTTAKKWECPTCMVYNNESDKSCVCCQTLNPDAKSTPGKTDSAKSPKLATSSASAAAQWTCPTCMVPNKPTSTSCVCCQEANPNPVEKSSASSSSPLAPTSSFKFGFSSTPIQSSSGGTKNSDGGFGCPKPSTDSNTDKTPFMFGFKAPTTTTTTTSGTSSSTSTSTTTSGFTFGAKSSSAASTPSFKFGINASDEEMLSKYPTIELWQCEVCPASNKMGLFSCVTCGSPRPHEFDAHYKKPEDKPKPDIKFQPVFKSSPGPTSTTAAAASGIFSVPTTTTATATSAFSNSNSFSSGNPFGGAGAFGSGTVGTGFGSLISTTPVTSTTTTQNSTTGGFGSFTSSTTNSGSASTFQFGMPSTETPKRKHEAGSVEGDVVKKPSQTFSFNTSSTPAPLKLKEVVSIQPQQLFTNTSVESDPPSVNNNAGFLQALKQASDAVKASNEKQPSIVPQPAKGFDFGASSSQSLPTFGSAAPSFTFGSSNTSMTPLPGQNTAPSMPSIGLAPAPQFNLTPNFNFGASTPAPTSSTFTFGNTSGAAQSSTPFAFQANNSIAPQAQAGVPPPQPSPLFQFQSTPTPGGGGAEGRKIKRATRRFAPR